MDAKRRGKAGFLKGKLSWSLYRATTTHRPTPPYAAAKVKPNPTAADDGGCMKMLPRSSGKPHHTYINFPAHHQLTPQLPTHTRSVSYYTPAITNMTAVDSYTAAHMDTLYGGAAVDDEVDFKAAKYISSVRERFRLDYFS